MTLNHHNDDSRLRDAARSVLVEREHKGLVGIVGDLELIRICCEPEYLADAASHLLATTGYRLKDAFISDTERVCVLSSADSADIIVYSRGSSDNPFAPFNRFPLSAHLPNTRLETLVFACRDVARYADIQHRNGVIFSTPGIIETAHYRYIETTPSALTGNAIGLIEWRVPEHEYRYQGCRDLDVMPSKPNHRYLERVGRLDHIATRVRGPERDQAIIEFMGLTEYVFDFAIHVPELNSITNVARLKDARFALVFTSGQRSDDTSENPGPTEAFVRNYGPRAHHMAFLTNDIIATHRELIDDGMEFLSDLVGSEEEGVRQVFSKPSPSTLIVNEYIERYGDFDGFFVFGNVRELTRATGEQ